MAWRLDMDADLGIYVLEDEQGEFARVTAVRDDHKRAALLVASPDLRDALVEAKRALWIGARDKWNMSDFKNWAVIQQIDAALSRADGEVRR